MKRKGLSLGIIAFIFISIIVFSIFVPVFYYFGGWIAGWIISICIGETFADGLNTLFNVSYFTADFLPTMCGILSVLGSFLRPLTINKDKEKN